MWKIKSLLPCIVILLCCRKIVEIGMFFQMRWKWTIVLWLFRASSSGHLSCWAMAATPWTWASRGWICRPKSKTKFHFCTVVYWRVFFSILAISCLTMMFSRIYTHDWVAIQWRIQVNTKICDTNCRWKITVDQSLTICGRWAKLSRFFFCTVVAMSNKSKRVFYTFCLLLQLCWVVSMLSNRGKSRVFFLSYLLKSNCVKDDW